MWTRMWKSTRHACSDDRGMFHLNVRDGASVLHFRGVFILWVCANRSQEDELPSGILVCTQIRETRSPLGHPPNPITSPWKDCEGSLLIEDVLRNRYSAYTHLAFRRWSVPTSRPWPFRPLDTTTWVGYGGIIISNCPKQCMSSWWGWEFHLQILLSETMSPGSDGSRWAWNLRTQ